MPTTRRKRLQQLAAPAAVTPALLQAYVDRDYNEIYRLLRMKPWQPHLLSLSGSCPAEDHSGDDKAWPRCECRMLDLRARLEAELDRRENQKSRRKS